MADNLEFIILKNLFADDEYLRKVVPFIKPSYFSEDCQIIYKQFIRHMSKYNKAPTEQMFSVEIDKSDISGAKYETIKEIIPHLYTKTDEVDKTWLLNNTEKWCQDRAIYNAIMESINIIDGNNKKLTVNALPDILQKALSVSFDRNVGHDYIEDFQKRFDFYHTPENKIPFEIELLNTITNGGLSDKTLNIILAGCVHPNTKVRIRYRKKE